jgi:Restriction endonuclease
MEQKHMDAELFAEAIEYELLTQAVYQAILNAEGAENIEVMHNREVTGRSGVAHQVDVSWRFRQAGIDHHVLVECKNFGTAITLEKVRNLFAVIHDIGNCQGIMVTKTGYQQGVVQFAEHYGIGLKLLRKPTDKDWEGRIKDIQVRMHILTLATSPEKAPRVELCLTADDPEELNIALAHKEFDPRVAPDMVFVNAEGVPITEQFRYWLPRQLAGGGNTAGGPFTKQIPLTDHFILVNTKDGKTRIVKVAGLTVQYHYEEQNIPDLVIAGEQVVQAILRDFNTGEVEHVRRRTD